MTSPTPTFQARERNPVVYQHALNCGLSPLTAHIVACRVNGEVNLPAIITPHPQYLSPPNLLKHSERAAQRIVEAIVQHQSIGILTDYDVDGVTSHAIIFRALTRYFKVPASQIAHFIGHRLKDGYGVSAALTQRILDLPQKPALIITADCGSSDEYYIAQLKQAGIEVIVTDHHAIPAEGIPASAYAVINPTQDDCPYPDATIAGCMTAWLLMAQVRQHLIQQQHLPATTPKLSALLSFVALGTVADCVSMASSANNRTVVQMGLQLINQFQEPCWIAIRELLNELKQPASLFTVQTLGFQLAPRINARSRMADPDAALRYLLADDTATARHYLNQLETDNKERRQVEREMVIQAKTQAQQQLQRMSLVIHLQQGHAGVQGIVASRLVQTFGKPALILCPHSLDEQQLTGSGRSIPGLHIRQALQYIADHHPGFFIKFGGHKGAAGFTLDKTHLPLLVQWFEQAVIAQLGQQPLKPIILTDGKLDIDLIAPATVAELETLQPYGREFDAPVFEGQFKVQQLRAMGSPAVHLSLELQTPRNTHRAVWFSALEQESEAWPFQVGDTIVGAYSLTLNDYRGQQRLQLQLHHAYRK